MGNFQVPFFCFSTAFRLLPTHLPKTSDFFDVKFRGFGIKVRRFYAKKSDVFNFRSPSLPHFGSLFTLLLKKSFLKKNYISYTDTSDILYLLIVSGEG